MTTVPGAPPAPAPPPPAGTARALPSPFVAVVGYTLRACLPAKRWWGVLLPCLGAVLFGWLATLADTSDERAFAFVAEQGLFGLVVPLTCLVIGDAVPVSALVALAEGGYGLEIVDGTQTRYVAVTLGMFAQGRVEVSGPDIAEGNGPPCLRHTRQVATPAVSIAGCVRSVAPSCSSGPCWHSCHRS